MRCSYAVSGPALRLCHRLNCEFGGMNEILYRLYGITKDPSHLAFAKMFDKPQFRQPMLAGTDVLPGLHANTHLAQV